MWLALAIGFAFTFLYLWLLARERARVRRDWDRLLHPGEKGDRALERRTRFERALAQITCAESFAEIEFGSLEDAKRLLDAGYEVIANFAPTLSDLLSARARFSRIVGAIPFWPAVRRGSLLMVTMSPRHRLRLYMVRRSCALVTRYVRDRSRRVAYPAHGELRETFQRLFGQRSSDALWQLAERREQWRSAPETPAMTLWAALIVVALVASVVLRQL